MRYKCRDKGVLILLQENDRQMLMEFWLFHLLKQGSRPLGYARPRKDQQEALVAFLLPVAEHYVNEADCQVILDPGPPCQVGFEFKLEDNLYSMQVLIDDASGCQPEELLLAAQQVDTFWLFVCQEGSQSTTLYEVEWHPQSTNR
ncbi:MAG: hypothetical protein ACM3PA_00465 [Methanomassiliicoccales archaeon]